MSFETWKYEKIPEKESMEALKEKNNFENILKIEELLNPSNQNEQIFLAEQTEKFTEKLDTIFSNLLLKWKTKDWNKYDFYAAKDSILN